MSNLIVNGRFLHQRLAGVQRYGREMLQAFDRAGYSYKVYEPDDSSFSARFSHQLWEQLSLPRRMGEDEVLWSPANSGPVFAPNHAITLHDIGVFPHPEWFSASYRMWKRFLIPQMAKRAQKIITVSEFSKQIICQYLNVDPDSVFVVYNGVDKTRFRPASTASIRRVRDKYSLTQPYLLTLGSMDPRKNFAGLIRAWKRCVKEASLTGYTLAIAGGHNVNFSELNIKHPPSSVQFLGYVDDEDLPALYSGAEIFLFPSLFEGFGLPVIEAMSCGTPVLTSNTTALKEVAAGAAFIVNPYDTENIKEGIFKLIGSPSCRQSLTDSGYKQAQKFDWDKAAARLYSYLTQ